MRIGIWSLAFRRRELFSWRRSKKIEVTLREFLIHTPHSRMSDCLICKAFTGNAVQHQECPNKNVLCRRCHQRGHMTHMCAEKWSHWERPTSMEELIPYHIKQRYRITSSTNLTFQMPRSNDTVKELHTANEIVIPDEYAGKKKRTDMINITGKTEEVTWHTLIIEIAERYNIIPKKPTKDYKPSSESYIQAIQELSLIQI